jgi:hypothetical protein
MIQLSYMAALVVLLIPVNRYAVERGETPAPPPVELDFSKIIVVNRWETVEVPRPPELLFLALLRTFLEPELRAASGEEPIERPRQEQHQKSYAALSDSRVPVQNSERVSWRRTKFLVRKFGQVRFVRGRAMPL